ncbi:MAG: proline racemase family protein [Aestuariivirgaceae bacterium]
MKADRMITVVGAHAEGEIGKVITGGVLPPPGDTLFEQQQWLQNENDGLRKFLLYEPRGGAFTHANLIVPAKSPEADAGFIIMEPDDYPPMSGSNCICVSTVLLETGMVTMREPETRMTLETPGGLVPVVAACSQGRVDNVTLTNVPCYAALLDQKIDVPGIGEVELDVGYGGAFFAIVDARRFGFDIVAAEARRLVEVGEAIKQAADEQLSVAHPENPQLNKIVFTEFTLPLETVDGELTGRNTVVISPGKLDRSPCGTGTCARMAVMHAKGELKVGDGFVSRSVINSRFDGRIESETELADGTRAILPSIRGRAWISGFHNYVLDPRDPWPEGYTLSDTWYRALD